MQGMATVDGRMVTKPGIMVSTGSFDLKVQEPKYVSRAGLKLEQALDHFVVDVNELIILDVGISTGGFADCLSNGAQKKSMVLMLGMAKFMKKLVMMSVWN